MLHAFPELRLEFDKCQEQINTHSAIQTCVITAFLLVQMNDLILIFCFIHLKKQLHLTFCLVDISNCIGSQFEIVGQKNVVLASFRITITNTTQLDGKFLCRLSTSKLNGLIAGQPFARQDRPATDLNLFYQLHMDVTVVSDDKPGAGVVFFGWGVFVARHFVRSGVVDDLNRFVGSQSSCLSFQLNAI